MILLITACERGGECAAALQHACGQEVERVTSAHAAQTCLRSRDYRAVVIDETLMELDSQLVEVMLRNPGMPVPIHVNFALCGKERMLREVQAALQRSEAERMLATRAAVSGLQGDLKNAVSGILLSSELALAVPGLPVDAEAKIRSVYELAQAMRQQLEQVAA